jgi:hypothetical protein
MRSLEDYLELSEKIPWWTRDEEAMALAKAACAFGGNVLSA